MVYYPGDDLRAMGKSIGEAFSEPAKVKLQMEVHRREEEEARAKAAARVRAAELATKEYGPTAGAFYEAGDASAYASLEGLKIKRARASGGGGGGGGGSGGVPNKYDKKRMDLAKMADEIITTKMAEAQEAIAAAKREKNEAKAKEAEEVFNGWTKVAEKNNETIKSIIMGPNSEAGRAADDELAKDPAKAALTNEAVKSSIVKTKALDSKLLLHLDNTKNSGLKIDLSGLASENDINAYAANLIAQKKIAADDVKFLNSITDPNDLRELANDRENQNIEFKALAGAKYTKMAFIEASKTRGFRPVKSDQSTQQDQEDTTHTSIKTKKVAGEIVRERITDAQAIKEMEGRKLRIGTAVK